MKDSRTSSYWPEDNRERLAIVAGCAALLFVFGGDVWRAALRTRDGMRDGMRESVPLEMEIDRARQLAASLVPDLRKNHEVIVREQVEIEELRVDIRQSREQLQIKRDQLLAIRARLLTSDNAAQATDSKQSAGNIRQDLQHRFATFQSDEATVDAKEQTLQYREESLAKAEAVQREMLRKKQELESQVVQFEARIKLMQRDGVDSQVVVDRDKLARCEELLRYLRRRLTIAERVSEFSEAGLTETRTSEKDYPDERIEKEIDRHFDREKG